MVHVESRCQMLTIQDQTGSWHKIPDVSLHSVKTFQVLGGKKNRESKLIVEYISALAEKIIGIRGPAKTKKRKSSTISVSGNLH